MDLLKVSRRDSEKVSDLNREPTAVQFLWSQNRVKTDAYMMMADVNSQNILQSWIKPSVLDLCGCFDVLLTVHLSIKMFCKQYGIPHCTHTLNSPCPYIKYWPEVCSLELKHVANCVLLTIRCVVLDWLYHFMNTGLELFTDLIFILLHKTERRLIFNMIKPYRNDPHSPAYQHVHHTYEMQRANLNSKNFAEFIYKYTVMYQSNTT